MAREKTKCMTSIGGQALIEGIMMRGPQKTAVAVRLPDKTIETEYLEIKTLRDKYPLFRAPLLRGIDAAGNRRVYRFPFHWVSGADAVGGKIR